jgi:hypothetical protein
MPQTRDWHEQEEEAKNIILNDPVLSRKPPEGIKDQIEALAYGLAY